MPNQVTTGVGTCKSGPIKNNAGTVLMGGNVNTNGPITNAPSLETILNNVPFYASQLVAAVSPNSSGNTGTTRVNTGAIFANKDPHFIMAKLTTALDGTSNTILQSMGGDSGQRRPIGRYYAATRYNYQGFDIFPRGSGKYTHGSEWGTDVLASGIDGTTGFYADKSVGRAVGGVPYKFTFMYGGPSASGKTYGSYTD